MDEPVEAVLFDVDGTLCEYRRSGAELLAAAFKHEGVEPFFRVKAYYDRFEKFAAHHDGIDDLRAACFAAIAADRGRDRAIGHALAGHYAAARDHGEVRYLPDAREAIDALADEHRLGVVTNGRPSTQKPKLAALGLTDAFGTVVYAGHDVAPKPDPTPFHRALDDMGARPERTVHVGNSLDADVAGAHAAGLRSVWVPDDAGAVEMEGPDDERADYVLDSLEELTTPPWQ